jgi:pyruvate,orthophosphate dikinase
VTIENEQMLTIDGTIGRVLLGAIPTIPPVIFPEFDEYLRWSDEVARLKVRTNADTPADAAKAIEFGAKGIGLCRTEHMFLHPDRLPAGREMLLAAERLEAEASGISKELENATGEKKARLDQHLHGVLGHMEGPMGHYRGALEKILPMQQGDFEQIFRVMAGKPVTIRLIDPPMHEFLPDHDALLEEVTRLRITSPGSAELHEKEAMLASVNAVREQNPMLGLRGCRLALLYPDQRRCGCRRSSAPPSSSRARASSAAGSDDPAGRIRDGTCAPAQSAGNDRAKGNGCRRRPDRLSVRHHDRTAPRRADGR